MAARFIHIFFYSMVLVFFGKLKHFNTIKANTENPKFVKHRNIINVVIT